MCPSRLMNDKISLLHEKYLRISYSDKTSYFEVLLEKEGLVIINTKNLQVLGTEVIKFYRNLSPNIVAEIFLRSSE